MPSLLDRAQTIDPTPGDSKQASRLAHLLESVPMEGTPSTFGEIEVSENVRLTLLHVLQQIGQGHSLAILTMDQELTPQQAARLLQVSRTHFMRAIQNQEIAYRLVGSHYRVTLRDVLAYQHRSERRSKILDELVDQAQELQMGY